MPLLVVGVHDGESLAGNDRSEAAVTSSLPLRTQTAAARSTRARGRARRERPRAPAVLRRPPTNRRCGARPPRQAERDQRARRRRPPASVRSRCPCSVHPTAAAPTRSVRAADSDCDCRVPWHLPATAMQTSGQVPDERVCQSAVLKGFNTTTSGPTYISTKRRAECAEAGESPRIGITPDFLRFAVGIRVQLRRHSQLLKGRSSPRPPVWHASRGSHDDLGLSRCGYR